MRSALIQAAALVALTLAGPAFAAGQATTPSSPSQPDTQPGRSLTPGPMGASTSANSGPSASTGASADTSATAGSSLQVGEAVKDNTGATIGTISNLNTGAGGQQMAVIKMGDQSFQVATDKLGTGEGAATINLSKSQLESMVHGGAGGH